MSLGVFTSHADYVRSVASFIRGRRYSRRVRRLILAFLRADLSFVDSMLAARYSVFGPRVFQPSAMLRSYLLSLARKVTSITDWVASMRDNPLLAVLSGFSPSHVPSVGSFYNFARRLWALATPNVLPHVRPKKAFPARPATRGDKAPDSSGATIAERLVFWQGAPVPASMPYLPLLFLFSGFLDRSVSLGLVRSSSLGLVGDGTPVYTSARPRSHRVCDCAEHGVFNCSCDRFFSQSDSFVGFDSSRECYFSGYNLYLLTESDSSHGLPIFPLLLPASRHDGLAFVDAFFTFRALLGDRLSVSRMALDAAHDSLDLHRFFLDAEIQAFIPLRSGAAGTLKDGFSLDVDGRPLCKEGRRMHSDGVEWARMRQKFRCPAVGRDGVCHCDSPCTESSYGPVLHIPIASNPRVFNVPARGSRAWAREYAKRTSAERANKRIKCDFLLESGRHRSSRMWYFRLYGILMLLHLLAW